MKAQRSYVITGMKGYLDTIGTKIRVFYELYVIYCTTIVRLDTITVFLLSISSSLMND